MELYHYGIKRRSGRYPYGSGERPYQSLKDKIKKEPGYNVDFGRGKTRDGVLKKGTEVERVASLSELHGDPHKRKYVSVDPADKTAYKDAYEYFTTDDPTLYIYELKKDVKIAEGKDVLDNLIDKYGDTSAKEYAKLNLSYRDDVVIDDIARGYDYKKKLDKKKHKPLFFVGNDLSTTTYYRYKSKGYTDEEIELAHEISTQRKNVENFVKKVLFDDKNTSEKIFKEYRDKGYDAMVDVEDWFSGWSNYPVILLDPAESATLKEYKAYGDWYD